MTFWSVLGLLMLLVWAAVLAGWKLAGGDLREASLGRARPDLPLALVLSMSLVVVLTGAIVFLCFVWALQANPSLPIDLRAAALARDVWSPGLQSAMLAVTHLADPVSLWSLGALVGLLLLRRREVVLLACWVAALGGNAALNPSLKLVFERIRPAPDISRLVVDGYSFPSGHSSGAMVSYGMLAYLVCRLLPPRWHFPACLLAATLILLIGASRVFLQAHFASDVLAGYGSGAAWLACCIAGCAAWRHAHGRCHLGSR